jgi:hypothetical protein
LRALKAERDIFMMLEKQWRRSQQAEEKLVNLA